MCWGGSHVFVQMSSGPFEAMPGHVRCQCGMMSYREATEVAQRLEAAERALAASAERERVLREAIGPIMAFLSATVTSADHQGNLKGMEPSDRLQSVNDTWLRRSDVTRLRAALAPTTPEEAADESG